MERFVCIHGHFYQPPRENPWLESVELQDSAAPYHDWNERITAECYAPNASARILDGKGHISEIVSNYSKISFNFGPTLLAWMRDKMPDVHAAIVAADRLSINRFSGHGSAMAQVYNHMILPLANSRDKYTQVLWGIRDFEFRFGRKPEGMWLAETAADTDTMETLTELGIKFTVLSPFQASRMREIGKKGWRDVDGGRIDPSRPYLMRLPSGRSITLFFYDAPVSQAVAFERLLDSGEGFAHRLLSGFNDRRPWEQLMHIATDGESYGHHHKQGEMALAYALHHIESNHQAKLTNYGEYLEKHPPSHEVQIHEKSAWSCSHGVGRWMTDCGCNSGGHGGWNQQWRTPLRNALDWLRDELVPLYKKKADEYLRDPRQARNEYISVILDRSFENREKFLTAHACRDLSNDDKVNVWKLMELQRHAMLMYTSCGWFFDEVSGIESVQVVQYAARTMQLARELFDKDFEPGFLERFDQARSNIAEHCDGRCIYGKFVKPAMIDMPKVAAHYAISSLFERFPSKLRIFAFTFDDEDKQTFSSGKTRLVVGRVRIVSEITLEAAVYSYAMLYLGEHNLTGSVRQFISLEAYAEMVQAVKAAFESADLPQTIRTIDRHLGETSYSLKSLFKDEQRRILTEILESTREDLESRFRLIMERYEPLTKFLEGANAPWPAALRAVSEFSLNGEIRRLLASESMNLERLKSLLLEVRRREIMDKDTGYALIKKLEEIMQRVAAQPSNLERLQMMEQLAQMVRQLDSGLNLWKVQNIYWEMLQSVFPRYRERAAGGDQQAQVWIESFLRLGEDLFFAVSHLAPATAVEPERQAA